MGTITRAAAMPGMAIMPTLSARRAIAMRGTAMLATAMRRWILAAPS